ncbi:phage tail protein [Vannielia litorea]|uniref:phage tail protein n=1 Tax=Vannielia litorea TaxID=1217970 RepID=UPI001C94251C|nr:phage tail protein [Vannielia litorea]MBY6152253.1 phage tail protein [Vannielia litorea]
MTADPYRRFNFVLRIDGEVVAGFTEASGLGAEVETVAYRDGGGPVRHLPGGMRLRPVTLTRGVASDAVARWCRASVDGTVERRDVELGLLAADGSEAACWRLYGAWVSSFRAGAEAAEAGLAMESMTLAFDRVERD